MILRGFFKTAEAAQAAIDRALAQLRVDLRAGATDAGDQSGQPLATVGSDVLGATALTDPATSEVEWRVTSWRGHSERVLSTMPTAQVPSTVRATATVRLERDELTNRPTAQAKAMLPAKIQVTTFQTSGTINIPINTQLEDPITGKRYKTTDNPYAALAAGAHSVNVVESDSTEPGEVTHGTQLVFTTPIANVLPVAQVLRLKSATVLAGATLTDPTTGLEYEVRANFTLPGTRDALSGDDVIDVYFVGATDDDAAIAVDTVLTLSPSTSGASPYVTVTSSPTITVDEGSTLNGGDYELTSDVTFGDSLYAYGSIRAALPGAAYNVTGSPTLDSPPSGVLAAVTPTEASTAQPYPQAYPRQAFGVGVELRSRITRESDGRYCAAVFTYPPGT